jgi:hyperosmotically inducible periplasmic protein
MRVIFGVLALLLVVSPSFAQARRGSQPSPRFTQRVQREVMHRILMLPYYGVFDAIGFKVEGYDVTLTGKVTRPTLKDDAANAIKNIEGVEHVNNRIEVLPVSFFDDRLRRDVFRAVYGYGPLQRYALPPIKPIRIIVEHGNVTLEGLVDSQFDKNVAGIRANGVPGAFSVTNNLVVTSGGGKKSK